MLDDKQDQTEDFYSFVKQKQQGNPFVSKENQKKLKVIDQTIFTKEDIQGPLFQNFKNNFLKNKQLFGELTWFRDEHCKDEQREHVLTKHLNHESSDALNSSELQTLNLATQMNYDNYCLFNNEKFK